MRKIYLLSVLLFPSLALAKVDPITQAVNGTTVIPSTASVTNCLRVPANGTDLISGPCVGDSTGIGTTSPNRRLHVAAASGSADVVTMSNADFVSGTVGTSLQFAAVSSFSNTSYGIQTWNTGETAQGSLLLNRFGGNVGIFTANATSKLHISSGTLLIDGNTQKAVDLGGTFKPWPRTKAQICALVPDSVGQYVDCTDCTLPGLCRSTGTAVCQFRKVESATLGCGPNN